MEFYEKKHTYRNSNYINTTFFIKLSGAQVPTCTGDFF